MATYQLVALREAHNNFEDLESVLYNYPSGLQWVLYIGYINAWGKLHRAEESLIEVEPVEMVIRGAMHDKLAIQDSNLSSRDELLRKIRQAVKELYPAMESRFVLNRPGEDSEEIHKLKKHLKQIADKVGIDIDDDIPDKNSENQVISVEAEARARLTLREIRRTLNEFRDRLWEGLVRARNNLVATIFIAGLVTHILLIIFILSSIPTQSEFLAAAVFGLTPNLLIRGLQQRAEKYMSALKSSKGAVEETFDNGN